MSGGQRGRVGYIKIWGEARWAEGRTPAARLERVEELVRKTRIYRETSKGQVVFSLLMVIIVGDTPTNIDSI